MEAQHMATCRCRRLVKSFFFTNQPVVQRYYHKQLSKSNKGLPIVLTPFVHGNGIMYYTLLYVSVVAEWLQVDRVIITDARLTAPAIRALW